MTSADALCKGDQGTGGTAPQFKGCFPRPQSPFLHTLSRQLCSGLCPGWQHPLACPTLPGAPQGTAGLAGVGWDWPAEPGSARQGFQQSSRAHLCRGQERQRMEYPLQQSQPVAQGCSLPHPWLLGLFPSPRSWQGIRCSMAGAFSLPLPVNY